MAEPKRKKYVRLTGGNAMWRNEKETVVITTLQPDRTVIEVSSIPEAALPEVDKAVADGDLEYIAKPDAKSTGTSNTRRTPLVKNERGSFEWKTDVKGKGSTGKVLNAASYSSRTMGYDNKDPVHQQAFKLLSEAPQNCVPEIQTVMSKLEDKKDRATLMKALLTVETGGHNPSMHPRTAVMEYVTDTLADMGISSPMNVIVSEDRSPVVQDIKPLRVNL
jgi:hypothetical protein